MSYLELRRELLKKLDITPQGLHERVKKRKRSVPMSTPDATCVIAHEQGIHVDRYIPPDDLERVRSLVRMGVQSSEREPRAKAAAPGRSRVERHVEVRFPSEFRLTDPILPKPKLEEARQMAQVYPLLYVLENSIREVIKRVMAAKYGADWWDTELTSGKAKSVHDAADTRRTQETTKNSWHQRRGAHPIDYTDLGQLLTVIQAKQGAFIPGVIPDADWFAQFMRELEPSRNVLCHMNPLDELNAKDVRQKLERWSRVVAAAAIP